MVGRKWLTHTAVVGREEIQLGQRGAGAIAEAPGDVAWGQLLGRALKFMVLRSWETAQEERNSGGC